MLKPVRTALAALLCAVSPGAGAQPLPAGQVQASAPGRIEGATDVLHLGAAATGIVAELTVGEGERVRAGQPLVRIDCRPIEAEVAARLGDVAAAEAALARLEKGARTEEIAIAEAEVRLESARATEAQASLQRLRRLTDPNITTRVQLDAAERDARMSAAQLDGARERLALLRAGARSEDIAEARARREAAKAAVDQARARLDQCTVRAPIDGVVVETRVTVGELVSPTLPVTLLRLVDDSRLKARAEVDERDLGRICPGQQAVVTAEGFPGLALPARVERINPQMGRRSILSTDPAEKSDRDVREVVLSLAEEARVLPIGLRVAVLFKACGGDSPQR